MMQPQPQQQQQRFAYRHQYRMGFPQMAASEVVDASSPCLQQAPANSRTYMMTAAPGIPCEVSSMHQIPRRMFYPARAVDESFPQPGGVRPQISQRSGGWPPPRYQLHPASAVPAPDLKPEITLAAAVKLPKRKRVAVDSVEGITAFMPRVSDVRPSKSVQQNPVDLSRLYMSLQCGFRSDIKWALETIACLLVGDGCPAPLQFFNLCALPRLLEHLVDLLHKSISKITSKPVDRLNPVIFNAIDKGGGGGGPFDREFAESCLVTLSLIMRNLSFLPSNFGALAVNQSLLRALNWMLGSGPRARLPRMQRETVIESALVTLANIGGCLRLSSNSRTLIKRLNSWAVDTNILAAARDTDPLTNLTPQRLSLECMAKMSVFPDNMRLLLQTIPEKAQETLLCILNEWLKEPKPRATHTDQYCLNEFSINLISGIISVVDAASFRKLVDSNRELSSLMPMRILKHLVFELEQLTERGKVDESNFSCTLKCSRCIAKWFKIGMKHVRLHQCTHFESTLFKILTGYPSLPATVTQSLSECLQLVISRSTGIQQTPPPPAAS